MSKPDMSALWAALEAAVEHHDHELMQTKHAMNRLRHAFKVWEQALTAYETAAGLRHEKAPDD